MFKVKLLMVVAAIVATPLAFGYQVSNNEVSAGGSSTTPAMQTNNVKAPLLNSAAQQLRAKLAQLPQFLATFNQQVFDAKGSLIQQASGTVAVAQPNQFRWVTNEPDESVIVSDGQAVWIYNPFVEQVTVMSLDDTVQQSPLWLIANQSDAAWSAFTVTKNDDAASFSIIPNDRNSLTRQIDMHFSQGAITKLTLKDSQGQSSEFVLSKFNRQPTFTGETFIFTVPENVDLDDQRAVK